MEASVFCAADEAALCHACDSTIHHANKLAGKHQRFSLHLPTSQDFPLCDICQEKRAYVFCKEDRAILCRECDLTIHSANEHTQKHNRFLLTGVKLSASSLDPSASSSSNYNNNNGSCGSNNTYTNENLSCSNISDTEAVSVSTSSFSEYLIETIPGYCFEDLLIDASFPPPNGFCKNEEHHPRSQDQNFQVTKNRAEGEGCIPRWWRSRWGVIWMQTALSSRKS
ncbi:B-box zinc finger protein 20 isoform X1 [Senna tora]|uniref:B-box zinc finger protein 20 isoform X1 n=1 Tax=Senna tora TaxID=362788 RepID=A0A834W9R8_9FABA|nr:B-box zinc finger protein 20 isoform X1 [Senna tora]